MLRREKNDRRLRPGVPVRRCEASSRLVRRTQHRQDRRTHPVWLAVLASVGGLGAKTRTYRPCRYLPTQSIFLVSSFPNALLNFAGFAIFDGCVTAFSAR